MAKKNNHKPLSQTGGLYPIRTVATLTGVNPITLRAWERRYQIISPKRTEKGHRLYTHEDVQQINQVTSLLKQGISISQIKPLLNPVNIGYDNSTQSASKDIWQGYIELMLNAIHEFDEHRLDHIYNDALSLYPIDIIAKHLLIPLLKSLGDQWKSCDTGIAEEHFFSLFLRNKLGARIQHLNRRSSGALLLIACLPGELHETGMLLFSLAALNYGFRTLLLGVNLPLEQIPRILQRRNCDAIVLSGLSRPNKDLLVTHLPNLIQTVSIPVFIGGSRADQCKEEIVISGAIYAGSEITVGLEIINQHIN